MRLLPYIALTLTSLIPSTGSAADVDYELGEKKITELSVGKVTKPFSIEVKDRVWVYKGIEEGVEQAKVQSISSSSTQCVRYEPSPDGKHVSHIVYYSDFPARAPDWIDDGLWPRTKEVLHYAKEPKPVPLIPETVLWLGPPHTQNVFSR